MLQRLDQVDTLRKKVSLNIAQERKAKLGQFMTPSTIARFMASLFAPTTLQTSRLLDAGAGIGSLSCAFLDRVASGGLPFKRVEIVAHEIDAKLRTHLSRTLDDYRKTLDLNISILPEDFIEAATRLIREGGTRFTHAIMNPPYKKINSASRHREALRQVGIETVNLYSAFAALAVDLLEDGGQIVAIIPRSFCNGPYYRPFRNILFSKTAIKRMHLFESRNRAFKDDDVLQENIIVVLEKGASQEAVTISTSTDDLFDDLETFVYPFESIVFPDDPERFIHVPTSPANKYIELSPTINSTLASLGLSVSTGPVVDFRLKEYLRQMPDKETVPLLYPCHFAGHSVQWPKADSKKPNALQYNDNTRKWLYPNGCYVVVRRFSSKEEKRRIVASVVDPKNFDTPMLGFENHLNVFHCEKKGLPESLALGLTVFLNSTAIDEQFRRFSGHTQVNATDLRLLKYPTREELTRLALWARNQNELTQHKIDKKVDAIAWQKTTT